MKSSAPVYLQMGRYDDAVRARGLALKFLGPTPERYVRYAEALSYAADGVVSPEAEIQIDQALKLDPKYMEARYFQGLAAAQHDEKDAARKIWSGHDRRIAGGIEGQGGGGRKNRHARRAGHSRDARLRGSNQAQATLPPGRTRSRK